MNSDTPERVDIFGVQVCVTTYEDAAKRIIEAGAQKRSFTMSALATHGLMEAVHDPAFRDVVNGLDLATPDGQPVRWAMNILHKVGLEERVYGPELTWRVCGAAAEAGIGIYLYGSTPETGEAFVAAILNEWPHAIISDVQPDRFREATPEEDAEDIERINKSGAGIVLVGRGCPRQEKWVGAHKGTVNAAMMAVGAAFDYHAGQLKKPPAVMQKYGLEWVWRLALEPRRLFKRYAVTNSQYVVALAKAVVKRPRT
ncbi:MAG: N-acetylglucosaminyldiphosphoundecaprenol N-acetyl-beta-D-mannosaminyltransferase [Verrucomicrobiales bacterium]|jgi:N-acetylglucosaminyldiphosphoundecaprenol N-acetyl-beta-D-mannosaminyltransferase